MATSSFLDRLRADRAREARLQQDRGYPEFASRHCAVSGQVARL
jgi:hypothetical protein